MLVRKFIYVHEILTDTQASGAGYFNFSNIRFGQAPVGPLRFSAPLAPTGRNTTVNDGQNSVMCPQAGPGINSMFKLNGVRIF